MSRAAIPPCGTVAAHSRHKRYHEKPCDACKAAMRIYRAAYKAERAAREPPRKPRAQMPPAAYYPNRLQIGDTIVTIHTDAVSHTYRAEVDGRYAGFVYRTDRGEAHHVPNEPHDSHIWFCCRPVAPVQGAYPDIYSALEALIGDT